MKEATTGVTYVVHSTTPSVDVTVARRSTSSNGRNSLSKAVALGVAIRCLMMPTAYGSFNIRHITEVPDVE